MSHQREPASVADVVAQALAATGTPFAFGYPGGEVVVLIDALRRAGVRPVLVHHENAAAFMAGGYGELTGRPGICISTLGPGATNMVTGVASAMLERAPVVSLTGALARSAPPGTTHQSLDLTALYTAASKRSVALTPDNAGLEICAAIADSMRPRPGPVHLSLAADVATSPWRGAATGVGDSAKSARVRPAGPALNRARSLLAGAQRPAIVAGLNAREPGIARGLVELAHAGAMPVAVLPKAKGVMREDDPFFLGTLEMAGDDLVVDFLKAADLLLLVGVDPVEFDKPWRFAAPVIHLDDVPNLDRFYPAEVELVGDVEATLRRLAASRRGSSWDLVAISTHQARLHAHVRPSGARLQPWHVVEAVRAALPPSALATCDVGAHKMLVGQVWQAFEPRTFFVANGLSSMGYSIPVATSLRLALPNRPTVAFVGDGGLSMYLGELETLVRLGVDILIVVFVDGSLELIRRAQLRAGLPTEGTTFANPDFAALGRAFGVAIYEVETTAALARSVAAAVRDSGVRLLPVRIDGTGYQF